MKKSAHLRIIGGQWKSRRLHFTALRGLRPTADALRETLFNWLPHHLHGKSCLDLFAGSGALGFEAASRGASRVLMVESNPRACYHLRQNRAALHAESIIKILPLSVEKFLRTPPSLKTTPTTPTPPSFDIVFMDPPFAPTSDTATDTPTPNTIAQTCQTLHTQNLLSPHALLYIESHHQDGNPPLPTHATTDTNTDTDTNANTSNNWQIIRQKRCGIVQATLIQT